MKIRVTITGIQRTQRELEGFLKRCPQAVGIGLYHLGERVMNASQRLVPVQTGELRDSAYVTAPDVSRSRVQVELGYGAEHAVEIHEDTSASHTTGQAKFLETAILQRARGAIYQVVKRAERAIARGERWQAGRYPTTPRK